MLTTEASLQLLLKKKKDEGGSSLMPPRPPPPLRPIRAQDVYAIASSIAQIAYRAAYLDTASAAPRAAGPSRPWPTQALKLQGTQNVKTHLSSEASLPPQAPDGTFTEMKHINRDGVTSLRGTETAQPATLGRLDDSLAAYFAEPESQPPGNVTAEPPSSIVPSLPPKPPSDSPHPSRDSSGVGLVRPKIRPTSDRPAIVPELPPEVNAKPPPDASWRMSSPSVQTANPPDAPGQKTPPPPYALNSEVTVHPAADPPLQNDAAPLEEPSNTNSEVTSSQGTETLEAYPEYDATKVERATPMRASKVPSSRIARLMHYGSLGAGLAVGAAGSFFRPAPSSGEPASEGQRSRSPFMSDSNIKRLVDKLGRMRGAALKLGQFLSIQDANILPPEIEAVLTQVHNSANYMPEWQMERVMAQEVGPDWRTHFASFSSTPFAAASIGQVHHGVLAADHPTHPNMTVAIKIQFPGIRESIDSDLGYLRWLLNASALLPRGLFLENTINQMRIELEDECDYEREAEMGRRFGAIFNNTGVASDAFQVPEIVPSLCGKRVLTTEMMKGRPLSHLDGYGQELRNKIATSLLHLSLSELFTHRLMQTDPNFGNFLYSPNTRKIQLIDFGATREYSKSFMDLWLRLLLSAFNEDREGCRHWSTAIGYLTGTESQEMVDAHVASMTLLGSPFRQAEPFDFTHQTLTDQIRQQIPVMLAQRQTPPPKETYSLNRKLSGAFLLCSKLKASVKCQDVLRDVLEGYHLEDGSVVRWTGEKLQVQAPVGHSSGPSSPVHSATRALHTSARCFDQVGEARSIPQEDHQLQTKRNERGRRVRERFGIDLGNRWPRSFYASGPSSASATSFDTLAPAPAGTSMATTPSEAAKATEAVRSDAPRRAEDLPAEGASAAETPKLAVEDDTSARQAEQNQSTKKVTIRGITIPIKPPPPGPEDCCMSGCARCVYDLFKEDIEMYQEDLTAVRARLMALSPPLSEQEWNDDLLGKRSFESAAHEKKDKGEKADAEVEAVIAGLDPTMKAFLEMERKMKKKKEKKQ